MANTLELTDEQKELLAEILQKELGDMSYEISDTDLSSYKDKLKERRDELKGIADQLNG